MPQERLGHDCPIITIVLTQLKLIELIHWGTNLMNIGNINVIKPIPQKACEQLGVICMFCRYKVPHPLLNQSEWSSEDWNGEKAKAKEQNPFIKSDVPKIKTGNPTTDLVDALPFQNLKIQPDRKDEKVPEVSTTPIPMLEQGSVGIAPKDSISKLDTVPEEQDETVAC